MDSSAPAEETATQVVFRPSKKRKQFRQRAEKDETAKADATSQPTAPQAPPPDSGATTHDDPDADGSETEGLSVAEALRLRNARKSRLKGVEFRPESAAREETAAEQAPAPKDEPDPAELGVSRRFAPQAGLVGELVNKHMEEYIESELARRYAADKAAQASASQEPGSLSAADAARADPTRKLGDQPTMRGRLQEVDLGDEVRLRNAALTEQARRRLAGEQVEDESDGSRQRVRMGKDGKPWRGRKRRASEDIQRDQMVEELMRENRLDVYDVSAQAEAAAEPGEDEAADERIAAEFRREFMDAMAARRNQRRRAPAPPPRPGAKQEEILRGPKLGGSRNARAAMRDILLSQQQQQKDTRKRR